VRYKYRIIGKKGVASYSLERTTPYSLERTTPYSLKETMKGMLHVRIGETSMQPKKGVK
jgi:hypothetical protein